MVPFLAICPLTLAQMDVAHFWHNKLVILPWCIIFLCFSKTVGFTLIQLLLESTNHHLDVAKFTFVLLINKLVCTTEAFS